MRSSYAAALIVCVLLLAGCVAAAPTRAVFEAWRARFGVSYATPAEHAHRMAVFEDNMRFIAAHNANSSRTYTMAANQFTDREFSEWAASLGNSGKIMRSLRSSLPPSPEAAATVLPPVTSLPTSVNWTAHGVLGPVRDDGTCSAAWSFTVTDTVAALVAIKTGSAVVPASPQQLIDCTMAEPWGLNGCGGGWPSVAYDYINAEGLCSEAEYPFHASSGECLNNCTRIVAANAIVAVPLPPSESTFMQHLTQQPVMTAIGVAREFQHYQSGVFNPPCNLPFEHCITIAGYGTEAGQDYWLVRNNFGTTWGEQGYMKLARGVVYPGGTVWGECDVLGLGMYPFMYGNPKP